jgi:uncharacterized protein (TIGR03790 family)
MTLIDRGLKADATYPTIDGWMVRSWDAARSVRYPYFIDTMAMFNKQDTLSLDYMDYYVTDEWYIQNTNTMFYYQSLDNVPSIETNTYVPGAAGDHLTSFGGILTNTSGQMPCLKYLQSGATGSYGTV